MIGSGIILPAPALRRSYFANLLRADGPFAPLLRELAPARWAEVRAEADHGPMRFYYALWTHINDHLFPLHEVDHEEATWTYMAEEGEEDPDDMTEEDVTYNAYSYGVPVVYEGVDHYNLYHLPNGRPAMTLLFWLAQKPEAGSYVPKSLQKYPEVLAALSGHRPLTLKKAARLPKGRVLRGRWQALPDLIDYYLGKTGNLFLDESDGYQDMNPEWSVQEINGLAAQWRRAQPIIARLKALNAYIEAKPAERLLALGLALAGDKETAQSLTEPSPPGKTLAEVFADDEKVTA